MASLSGGHHCPLLPHFIKRLSRCSLIALVGRLVSGAKHARRRKARQERAGARLARPTGRSAWCSFASVPLARDS